jgi:uncharacterized protein involved in exopolysaccharide biosynthesis
MLQTYNLQSETLDDVGGRSLGIGHYLGMAKRRALYFLIPFTLGLLAGALVTAIQRPIYQAAGKVLVESQQIPADLVKPTVTDTANQRIQVIQQRIMTRDNLLALVKKYQMFPHERRWMSDTEVLDLMRQRTAFTLVDSNAAQPGAATIAFTVSFEYENPQITLSVTNDLLTLILSEDARNRTNRATETTTFLMHESQRLQGALAAIETQITESKIKPRDSADATDPVKLQMAELTKLKEELAQMSSTYSAQYPAIKALKRKIAAMEKLVAQAPSPAVQQANAGLVELERQAIALEKQLDDTNKKLEEARLGERLERDQESERLAVIEQPAMPQRPVKPNRTKLLAASFGLAIAIGLGIVYAAESLDGSIRHAHELFGIADGRLVVSVPYIATRAETFRRRRRMVVGAILFCAVILAGVVVAILYVPSMDLSWVNQFWLDHLTHLSR